MWKYFEHIEDPRKQLFLKIEKLLIIMKKNKKKGLKRELKMKKEKKQVKKSKRMKRKKF